MNGRNVLREFEKDGYSVKVKDLDIRRVYDKQKCMNFFDKKSNFFGVFIDCGFEEKQYLYISILYGGLYYGIVQVEGDKSIEIDKDKSPSAFLEYMGWNELKWYAKVYKKIDMTDLSDDKVLSVLRNYKDSPMHKDILNLINEIKDKTSK